MSRLLLVAVALSLSACASTGSAPRGWGAGSDAPRARPSAPAPRPAPTARASPRAEPRAETGARRPASGALMMPVVGVSAGDLRDSFTAPRSGGRTHNAIDISAPRGTPLVAVTDGTITRRSWNRLGGKTLYLTSTDGQTDYYYAHLDEYAAGIDAGTRVRRGEIVGTVGSTGNARGPHLHLQILDRRGGGRGVPVNPYEVLRAAELASSE